MTDNEPDYADAGAALFLLLVVFGLPLLIAIVDEIGDWL